MMNLAYITTITPFDKHSWSGTNYYARAALEAQGANVQCLYGYRRITPAMVFHKVAARLMGRHYQAVRSMASAKGWARFITRGLAKDTDAILSMSTIPVACLETDVPIYVWIDGCYEYMLGQGFCKMANDAATAHAIERLAFGRCARIFTCSGAAAAAIRQHYGENVYGKVDVVPLGANIDEPPTQEAVMQVIRRKDMETCRLLFVGVEWQRKGADIVVETAKRLHDDGFPVELHLVGLRDAPGQLPPYIICHGFIDKNQPEGMAKLADLYQGCHFLFVPSRGEAYGLVFCEASAYGLPSISHSIGGIPTIVKDGENGKLFPIGTSPDTFAQYIKETFADREGYRYLAASAYNSFATRLSWNAAATRLLQEMRSKN